jgi:NADP-dependent 3-hydroxy acid dehydrogenase YdfG
MSLIRHQEVNVKDVYLNVHHFLKQAPDGKGTVITLSTGTLGDIYPDFASYIPSKLAQTKFMEFLREGKSKWYSKTILYHC